MFSWQHHKGGRSMLMNGKDINHLVLSGEVFTSDKALPKYYVFKNKSVSYYWLTIDENNNFSFKEAIALAYNGEDAYHKHLQVTFANKTPVLQIEKYKGENYALVYGKAEFETSDAYFSVIEINVWVKISETGGMTPYQNSGGGK